MPHQQIYNLELKNYDGDKKHRIDCIGDISCVSFLGCVGTKETKLEPKAEGKAL